MSVCIDEGKVNSILKKGCQSCLHLTDHKYIETCEKIIPDYRPYSGKRRLTPREAKETSEHWQCTVCGHFGTFSSKLEYKERKRRVE